MPTPKGTPQFSMTFHDFWDSGLAAAVGPDATFVLMALTRFMNKDGYVAFPSQKRLAALMGVSEQTANKYVRKLLKCRFNDGKPLVTATERANGRPWQSRYEYHVDPRCQVSHGPTPLPIDPALVPSQKPRDTKNVERAREALRQKRQTGGESNLMD